MCFLIQMPLTVSDFRAESQSGGFQSPEGTAPEARDTPIGVADISLRGLGGPEVGEQNNFCSPTFIKTSNATIRFFCIPDMALLLRNGVFLLYISEYNL